MRKCVRIRIGLKLILSLAIIVAGILAGCYANVLWVNIITLVVVPAVGLDIEFLGSISNDAIEKVLGRDNTTGVYERLLAIGSG